MGETDLRLNAEALTRLDSLPSLPPIWDRTIEQWRIDTHDECLEAGGIPELVESVEELTIDSVPARLYRPAGDETDVLVWLHGGGWVVSDLDCCDAVARAIANRAKCGVLTVGYRRAPEFPYPAAVEDSWEAVLWALEKFEQVAVGGDSAGGNLAAIVARRARDIDVSLCLQLLVYPVMDWRVDSPSYENFARRYDEAFPYVEGFGTMWCKSVKYLWDTYAPDESRRSEYDASPLRASSFAGIAPTLILTAEHDIFRSEDEEYARRLVDEQVGVEIQLYEGQMHGFYHLIGEMSDARQAIDRSASALRESFTRNLAI